MKQFNICSRNGRCYDGNNAEKLSSVQRVRKYLTGAWITRNQVENDKGKYIWQELAIDPDAQGVSIEKLDNATGEPIRTVVYNLDQTNFGMVYPGMLAALCEGQTPQEAIQTLLRQPLRPTIKQDVPMLERAMATGKQKPKGFWKRVAAVF